MKKIGIVVLAFVLAGIAAWFFLLRTNPAEKPDSGKAPPATVQKSQAAAEVPKVHPEDKTKPSIPSPARPVSPTPSVVGTSVVDVIAGDVEMPEKNVFSEPYIKRCRPIQINPQVFDKDGTLAAGSRFNLALFPDAKYAVTLQMVNRSPQGDLQIGGKLDGEEYGTFILSTASGVVLARLADPKSKRLFLIRCGGQDRGEYVVEVDPTKVPVPGHFASDVIPEK